MHISRAGEYGVLGLLHLVRQPAGQPVMIDAVSRDEDIPKSFLAKIFQDLAKAGILRSQRGAGGGFTLARSAERISVLDIIEAIDGKIALQRCLGEVPDCEKRESCALCSLFEEAQLSLKEIFGRTTLLQLAARQSALELRNGSAAVRNGEDHSNGHKVPEMVNGNGRPLRYAARSATSHECSGCVDCNNGRSSPPDGTPSHFPNPFNNESLALEP